MDHLKILFHLAFRLRSELLKKKFFISRDSGPEFLGLKGGYLTLDGLDNNLELFNETKIVWIVLDDKLQEIRYYLNF